jgi:hypothetical protein
MTEPEPGDAVVDDSYPSAWRPSYIRERDDALEPLAIERALAAMDPRERAAMLRRIEAMR